MILISISTAGQGDLPNNARRFWSMLLRKKLPQTCLRNVHFTIFGLGDSSYPKYGQLFIFFSHYTDIAFRYNFAARKLQRRLIQLGAEEIFLQGEGDEQHPEGYLTLDGILLKNRQLTLALGTSRLLFHG